MILVLVAILGGIFTVIVGGIAIFEFLIKIHVPRRVFVAVIVAIGIIALVLTLVTQQTSASSPPSQQAQDIISKYYSYINIHHYQDAYNLLGSAMQRQQSYHNFVAGYAHTSSVTFTIQTITPQSDGSVIVTLTLTAAEDTNAGTQVSTYLGTDIVGQENGKWKILSGNFQLTG